MQNTFSNSRTSEDSISFGALLFGRLWAAWGIISFIVTFLIIFIPSMCAYLFSDEKKGQDYFIWVSRCWMRFWLPIIGCPVKVTGLENFKSGETYVVVFNHNALLDVPLSAPFIPAGNKTIAKASFAKVPVFGLFYKRGSVLVDRSDNASRIKSFEDMKAVLEKGMHMCLYPEGTRNRTNDTLKPFYDGAFKLAIRAKKNVLPCVILGTREAVPINTPFCFFPTRLQLHFLPQVSSSGVDTKTLKENIFTLMKEHYEKGA